jgi:nascent polypeptide-associated complex subunit alpha
MNPKKMQAMMKQLGINQEEIEAERVAIEKENGGKIVIESPNVQKINMQGQESWQITGEVREEEGGGVSEDDVKLVMEKTGKGEDEVRKVLEEEGGQVAEAIIKLSSD